MEARRHATNDDDLLRAKRQLGRWRASHLTGTRIPDRLWQSAANAVKNHGLSYTSKELGLNYNRLKDRAAQSNDDALPDRSALHSAPDAAGQHVADVPPQFVEFSLGEVLNATSCVVEIQGANDRKLRLDLKGYAATELDVLLRAIWEPMRCSS